MSLSDAKQASVVPGTAGRYASHFERVANCYDQLRSEADPSVIDFLLEGGEFTRARAILDVGCGTGATTVTLARICGCETVGVDSSPSMLAAAKGRESAVTWLLGRAEALPVRDRGFDRVLMQTMVHLVDREQAFVEARRVLSPRGRLVILTLDPELLVDFWLSSLLDSWLPLERKRFPSAERLTRTAQRAGFRRVAVIPRSRRLSLTRSHALRMLQERFASSFALLDDSELRTGIRRAERTLPEAFESTLPLLLMTAERPLR